MQPFALLAFLLCLSPLLPITHADQYSNSLVLATKLNPIPGTNLFYLLMDIGTPPQMFRLMLDTSSSTLLVPSVLAGANINSTYLSPCALYGDPESTSGSPVPCSDICAECIPYSTSSYSGEICSMHLLEYYYPTNEFVQMKAVLQNDAVTLQDWSATIDFTAWYYITSYQSQDPLCTYVDGKVGFAAGEDSWFNTLTNLNENLNPIFSLCLSPEGGVIVIGGYDYSLYEGKIVYTTLQSLTPYAMAVENLQVNGGNSIPLNTNAIISSASPYIELTQEAYDLLAQSITDLYCDALQPPIGLCGNETFFTGSCFYLAVDDFLVYPFISIVVDKGLNLTLDSKNYLFQTLDEWNGFYSYCLAIRVSSTNNTVLGTPLMTKFYTVFDLVEERIGFAFSTKCSESRYILEEVSGNNQKGIVSRSLDDPLEVLVLRYNDSVPVEGVSVHWSVSLGGGQITSSTKSNYKGIATASLTLGPEIGTNIILADITGAINSPVAFTSESHNGYWFWTRGILMLLILFLIIIAVVVRSKKLKKREMQEQLREAIQSIGIEMSASEAALRTVDFSMSPINSPELEPEKPILTSKDTISMLEWANIHENPLRPPTSTLRSSESPYRSSSTSPAPGEREVIFTVQKEDVDAGRRRQKADPFKYDEPEKREEDSQISIRAHSRTKSAELMLQNTMSLLRDFDDD